MGAGDALRSDVERREPVRQSARGVDRRGLQWRPKPGPSTRPWKCRQCDRGWQREPYRRASGHVRAPVVGLRAPPSTRLETRTKESDMCASQRVENPGGARKLIGGIPFSGAPPTDLDLLRRVRV